MDCLSSFFVCLPTKAASPPPCAQPSEKAVITQQPVPYSDDAAAQFVETLRTAEKYGPELESRLNQIVSTNGWTENLAKAILNGIQKLLQDGEHMAAAMVEANKKALATAEEFAKEHPYYTALIAAGTLIALGVLAFMAPGWVLEALGFAARGPRANSFASEWMSRIAVEKGQVSKGSLYSYLQRLGMKWVKPGSALVRCVEL